MVEESCGRVAIRGGTIYQAQMATGMRSPKLKSVIWMEYLWNNLLTSRILGLKITEHSSSNSGCGGAAQRLVWGKRLSRNLSLSYKNPSPMTMRIAILSRWWIRRFRTTNMGNSAQRRLVMTAEATLM